MDNHQHTPVDVYSERFIDPIMVRCSECGETLIGPIGLCLYIDSYRFNPSVSVKIKVTDHRPRIAFNDFYSNGRLEFDAELL
jgi:hypothetical protein